MGTSYQKLSMVSDILFVALVEQACHAGFAEDPLSQWRFPLDVAKRPSSGVRSSACSATRLRTSLSRCRAAQQQAIPSGAGANRDIGSLKPAETHGDGSP